MKKLIISTLAVLALTTTAYATDLPSKTKAPVPTPAPVAAAPAEDVTFVTTCVSGTNCKTRKPALAVLVDAETTDNCESPVDVSGIPKRHLTRWDKPCTSNEECPFYKKNTKYPNTRGGCLENGYCEMPIGLLQASPHVYYDTGKFQPFCYGCTPGNDPDCCNKTKDYAFPNDTNDRMKNGLKTSISLM